jgi:hypothetical protein
MKSFSTSKIIFIFLALCFGSFIIGNFYFNVNTKAASNSTDTKNAVIFAASKTAKPELKFFVMSFCPYGNQIEDAIRPVFDLLKDRADFVPHYIFQKISDLPSYCKTRAGDINLCSTYIQNGYFKTATECKDAITKNSALCLDEKSYIKSTNGAFYASLHGRQEGNQNVREICAWNQVGNDKKIWWDFVGGINKNCTSENADTCWEEQGKKAGLDTNKITECFNKEAFDLIEKEISVATQYKAQSSPTVLINDVIFPPEAAYTQEGTGSLMIGKKVAIQDKYRTPNVIKEAVCASMKKSAKECSTILNELSGAKPAIGGCGN